MTSAVDDRNLMAVKPRARTVFDQDGDPVQRASDLALATLIIQSLSNSQNIVYWGGFNDCQ